jgi:NADPH:quinone reductase-like Zn-dependent oxidoreductase
MQGRLVLGSRPFSLPMCLARKNYFFHPPGALEKLFLRRTVTATASTQEKLDWLLSIPMGATHTVNYKTQDFSEEVKKVTSNKGVDVIIDFVGQSHWRKNIDSLGVDGRMIILSALSGEEQPSHLSLG